MKKIIYTNLQDKIDEGSESATDLAELIKMTCGELKSVSIKHKRIKSKITPSKRLAKCITQGLIFLLFPLSAFCQQYEYAYLYEISSGMVQTKAEFTFGTKYDSVKAYGKYKHAVDALDFSSKKGWELFQVFTQQTTAQATIYLLRRRKE